MVNIITLDFSKVFFTWFEWVNILLWGNRSWVKFLPGSLLGMPSKYAELPGIYISKYLPCQWVHTVEKSHSTSSPENLVRDDTFRYDCHFNFYVSSSVTNMKKSQAQDGSMHSSVFIWESKDLSFCTGDIWKIELMKIWFPKCPSFSSSLFLPQLFILWENSLSQFLWVWHIKENDTGNLKTPMSKVWIANLFSSCKGLLFLFFSFLFQI